MDASTQFLMREARALLRRLAQVRPFSATTPVVAGAGLSSQALRAIESHLIRGRRELHTRLREFARWIQSPSGSLASPELRQRRFTLLRMQFNATLDELDVFADVLNQRSEHETGLWLGGLDAVAADGLTRPGVLDNVPPVITYLDRGHGAAIRRARTRLPGGKANPVAVVRVPRERMVGNGVGSSLLHEVGHQAADILGLVRSLRESLMRRSRRNVVDRPVWSLWER